ncbi:hypothetical protein CC85DRAFT_289034 [Cutaneotrichosporon oleaginosum]|uniref:CST complex subunit Stn1 N-terminal domain-containing protein n=1 Tax=Cutaneotrichosporon oleaginosum TaxID=879819 RepID=A0A0J0XD31_9TREE|nr:uncharacterized protein CC85DRAFT_289034 [Cutaneotrichosporon oleaginosum]KLT38957.1 hypothetical protein CC85DRAFT_289034 [Cutaneotrichosporon oleaginosum]TXT07605.1 hypothetical protein COLE_04529 [Cutaneotrichosporon oleaginosum]
MHASSSARPLEALPSLAALQSWVHRPQARAPCFVSDVYALRALREEHGTITRPAKDVYLLERFPCKFVELVGWAAGVDHKDASITITLDDGDGLCVLNVIVKLAHVEIPVGGKGKGKMEDGKTEEETPAQNKSETRSTFRSARQRDFRSRPQPPQPPAKVYVRPNIQVGDMLRLSGYVEDWARRTETVRQVVVDEASGSGYIRVVDPDEQYEHVEAVNHMRREVYSRPFELPAAEPPSSVRSSPAKSMASTWDATSDLDAVEDDLGPDLPNPSKLSSKLLNEKTFKYYLMDHLVRETRRALSSATRVLLADPSAQVKELAALFPEYAACTVPPRRGRATLSRCVSPTPTTPACERKPSPTPLPQRLATPDIFTPSRAENTPSYETPRPRVTFRSKAEREAARVPLDSCRGSPASVSGERTPMARPLRRSLPPKAERERCFKPGANPFVTQATPRASPANVSFLSLEPLSFEPFTVPALLAVERLRALAALVVDARARREEGERRKRVKEGRVTLEDEKIVANRRARGLRSSDYKLTDEERQRKMARLVTWAIRTAASEGEVVQVEGTSHSLRTMESFDSCVSLSVLSQEAGYVPIPPELLGPLLLPLAAAARAEIRPTFRSRAEREANVWHEQRVVDTHVLLTRLRQWGEDGRWERVTEKPVQEAAEWAEASGLLRLGV